MLLPDQARQRRTSSDWHRADRHQDQQARLGRSDPNQDHCQLEHFRSPVAIQIFADSADPQKPPLDAIRDTILRCHSIADIEELCRS